MASNGHKLAAKPRPGTAASLPGRGLPVPKYGVQRVRAVSSFAWLGGVSRPALENPNASRPNENTNGVTCG